jgi:DNA replication initiation complex subunit (GINS family)
MPDPYTQLLEWRRAEGAARGLAKLPLEFYETTRGYLAEVRRTFENELRENPGGKKGDLARQTHARASQVARDIVEARMSKILSVAFQGSIGGSREVPNALPEERGLFDQLSRVLRGHRTEVAPFLESPTGTNPTSPAVAHGVGVAAHPSVPSHGPSVAPAPSAPKVTYVRVLKDGPAVEIGTETIELRAQDVLALPEERAKLLVQSGLAEPIRRDGRTVTT